jgi:DNA-binding beta-propeller fold protein YncE
VAVDSEDRVYLLCRGDDPVMVYAPDGRFLKSWGQGLFTFRTHGITIGPDNSVYCVDDGAHCVRKLTPDGELLMTLGTPHQPSDTGYRSGELESIARPGGPFNRPTNLAVGPSGELYVADGYGNCRVHRFSPSGELRQSWGEPGSGPGQFMLPHGIAVRPDGRVFVCDRENERIQIFSPDGEHLDAWLDVQRPAHLVFGADGLAYVVEFPWWAGERSYRHGLVPCDVPGRVSVLDALGQRVARWGNPDPAAPDGLCASHGIAVDSRGDVYVAEVTHSACVATGKLPAETATFQKFRRL